MIQNYSGGGSTELIPALKRVYAEPKAPNVSRTVVVVTDGYVTVEREVFKLVARNLGKSNVFAFGIGSSVNRHLIEGIARAVLKELLAEAPGRIRRLSADWTGGRTGWWLWWD